VNRWDRRHGRNERPELFKAPSSEQRDEFQRDRDRIIYSSAFHRLAGITQIARAGEESVFHTRQQHSLKVAQVGRRLAQDRIKKQPVEAEAAGVNEEVVEAACLIHDLGLPPFGHIGEETLNRLVTDDDKEGFEGNAQSFRIITKLAARKEDYPGMNLTRATLAASLKYPWIRGKDGSKKHRKWSVYSTEVDDFEFAKKIINGERKTVEADMMDWSDDISYSVHDLEDFHRCGAVPWSEIFSSSGKQRILSKFDDVKIIDYENAFDKLRGAIYDLHGEILNQRYEGTVLQRYHLRSMTSDLIALYINSTRICRNNNVWVLQIDPKARIQVDILKQITWDYIISNPPLAAQQVGYARIVTDLFEIFTSEKATKMPLFTPVRLQYLWNLNNTKVRFAADCIASLSEAEAMAMHARLTGYSSGSVLNPIVR
jgi:dGTPase